MIVEPTIAVLIRSFALAVAIAVYSATAAAGEFFEKDGAAIRGYDPVAYFTDGKPVKGSPDYKADYKGSTFHFKSRPIQRSMPRSTEASARSARPAVTRPRRTRRRSRSSGTSST
jgi:hypothetical protein